MQYAIFFRPTSIVGIRWYFVHNESTFSSTRNELAKFCDVLGKSWAGISTATSTYFKIQSGNEIQNDDGGDNVACTEWVIYQSIALFSWKKNTCFSEIFLSGQIKWYEKISADGCVCIQIYIGKIQT